MVVDEAPVVDETPVDVVPLDDCGVICQNVAGEPEPAVYKNDDVPPEVLQFGANGEAPDPAQNISAELSGAIGAAEQSAAAAVAVSDGALVDPLSATAPTAILAKAAGADGVNVIRDGHLR